MAQRLERRRWNELTEPNPTPVPARFDESAPEAHWAMLGLDGALWLEPRLRELVAVRTAQLNGSADRLVRHARQALELGELTHRLVALGDWRRSSLFSPVERAALGLVDAVALLPDARSLAAAHRKAASQFDQEELAQLVFACVSANAWDRLELTAGGEG